MEHTINLASKAFIEAICPAPSQYKKGKRKIIASKGVDSDGEHSDNNDSELEWLANLATGSPIDANAEIDEEMDFDPEDLLGKVLALINQVLISSHVSLTVRLTPVSRYALHHRRRSSSQLCARKKD
jgi:hypothetical protein